jgi:hypothetical protein
MARGWESKSVEEQQSEFNKPASKSAPSASPRARQRTASMEALEMKRAHVMQQLQQAQNPRFVDLMQSELAYLDREIAQLKASDE